MGYEQAPVKTLTLNKYRIDVYTSEYNGNTFYSFTVYKTFTKRDQSEGKDYRIDQWDGVDEAIILLLNARSWVKSQARRPEHSVVKAPDDLFPEQRSAPPSRTPLEKDDIPF